MIRLAIAASLLGLALISAGPAVSIGPDELLDDPVLEARARSISKLLRCVVCQNQSIDDSNAEIARDMRLIVRERLIAGDSDTETIGYLVTRYGDFVLLAPPFKASTLPLWLGPPVLILLIGTIVAVRTRRALRNAAGSTVDGDALSADDQERLDTLLADLDEDRDET